MKFWSLRWWEEQGDIEKEIHFILLWQSKPGKQLEHGLGRQEAYQVKIKLACRLTAQLWAHGNISSPRFPHLQIGTKDHFPAPLEGRIWRRVMYSCLTLYIFLFYKWGLLLFLPCLSKIRCGCNGFAWGEEKGLVPGSCVTGMCS